MYRSSCKFLYSHQWIDSTLRCIKIQAFRFEFFKSLTSSNVPLYAWVIKIVPETRFIEPVVQQSLVAIEYYVQNNLVFHQRNWNLNWVVSREGFF